MPPTQTKDYSFEIFLIIKLIYGFNEWKHLSKLEEDQAKQLCAGMAQQTDNRQTDGQVKTLYPLQLLSITNVLSQK